MAHHTTLVPCWSRCLALLLAAAGCDCGGKGSDAGAPPSCSTPADCPGGAPCVNGTCVTGGDGGIHVADGGNTGDAGPCPTPRSCRQGRICCPEGQECVGNYACDPVCPNVRCGDNLLECCNAGMICLDGVVCAVACEQGRTLCGTALDTCCQVGQVCVNSACMTPGATCGDDYDCLAEGTYCEPTVDKCLPNPSTPMCEVKPDFQDVTIEEEWHWEGVEVNGVTYQQIATTPAIGDVSGDGIPDVVVPVYRADDDAVLVALNGRNGQLLWTISGANAPAWLSMVAVGNLDPSDAALEIVYKLQTTGLRVIKGNGTTEMARVDTGSGATSRLIAPALADMDGDGKVEIAAGCHVLRLNRDAGGAFSLQMVFDVGPCLEPSQRSAEVAIANLDGDPQMEITTGEAAFDFPSGQKMWPSTAVTNHGLPAVADLDGNGTPEVIVVRAGRVVIRNGTTGAVLVGSGGSWLNADVQIPGGGIGGAPTVADFDGDGLPEVSAAGQGCYAVYDLDCLPNPPRSGGNCTRPPNDPNTTCDDSPSPLLRWAKKTQDISSSVTGSSVFDFQGDGVAEVVYNDECFLHIYNGADGREVLAAPRPNSSRTALEYAIVVDVDRDGNSEIVVPANDDQAVTRDKCHEQYAKALGINITGLTAEQIIAQLPAEYGRGRHGLFVLGDPADRWVRTRPVWNQFTYHVTNIGDLGEIPQHEEDNWRATGLNNYRQNVQGAGVFNAPNLAVELTAVALCGSSTVQLSTVVKNVGSRGVPAGVSVDLVQVLPTPEQLLQAVTTTRPLLPGGSERLTITINNIPYAQELKYEARVDGTSATAHVAECNEGDNSASATQFCEMEG